MARHARIVFILAAVLAGGGATVALIREVRLARAMAGESNCTGRLYGIMLGLLEYQEMYGSLPPAVTYDSGGRPMHSWRVLILPTMGAAWQLNPQYDYSEPWDGPSNRRLIDSDTAAVIYACPNRSDGWSHGDTSYVMPAAWPADLPVRDDGAELTDEQRRELPIVIETPRPGISWLEPRDVDVNTAEENAVLLDVRDPTGLAIGFDDLRYFRLRRGVSFAALVKRAKEVADKNGRWRDKLVEERILIPPAVKQAEPHDDFEQRRASQIRDTD